MKTFLFAFGLLVAVAAQAQSDFEAVPLGNRAELKAAEPVVVEAVNYLFATPLSDDARRLQAHRLIIRWMSDTKDYSFNLDDLAAKLMKGSDVMLPLYMAAMAGYVLANPADAKYAAKVKLGAVNRLLDYCEKSENKVSLNKAVKSLLEARNDGKLEKELK